MPKRAKELTAIEVSRLKEDGLYAAGGVPGLYLQVRGAGRSWVLRTMVGDKRRDMGLGPYPGVTLALARDKARAARETIGSGLDPIAERRKALSALKASQAAMLTFDEAARQFIDAKCDEWRNAKHRQQWVSTLETYAGPVIGALQVADIRREHVLAVLQPIWKSKTETAVRLRGRIEQVLDWAKVRGYRSGDNPAAWRGHLDKLLPNPSKIAKTVHHRAIAVDEMPAFLASVRERSGIGPRALELLALTAVRSGELRLATWDEFDLDAAAWTIPAERMKAKREHRVPLSSAALEVLRSLPVHEGCPYLFPGSKGKPISDMTLTALMRRMEVDAVPHGLRSTFRDWASERTSFPSDVVEMALAHTIANKTEAAYRRGDLFAKRAELMEAWASYCLGAEGSPLTVTE